MSPQTPAEQPDEPEEPGEPEEGDGTEEQPAPPPADLDHDELAEAVGERPLRTFAEITSTQWELRTWAREGAPHGALVVAGHQVAPRGRSGLSWAGLLERGHGVGFSLLRREGGPAGNVGWLYLAGLLALADGLGHGGLGLEWPDEVRRDGDLVAALSVRPADGTGTWAIVNAVVPGAEPPRTALLGRLVASLEARLDGDPDEVLADYRERCGTLGRRVRVRMLPLGPSAGTVVGAATDVDGTGALLVGTRDATTTVSPDDLGFLEDPEEDARPPDDTLA